MSERGHLENIIGPLRGVIELRFKFKEMKERIKELEARVKKLEKKK